MAAAEQRRRSRIQRRDTVFRRMLGVADTLALAGSLGVVALIVGTDRLGWPLLSAIPILIVLAKLMGLYDRDEHLLAKSTLDEVPQLFNLAALTTLIVFLASGGMLPVRLGSPDVVVLWSSLLILLAALRGVARWLAAKLTPGERCLLVGDEATAELLRQKLGSSHATDAVLIDSLTITSDRSQAIELTGLLPTIEPLLAAADVDRVVLAQDPHNADELMFVINEFKTLGVKVSVLPAISRVAGTSVELDHLSGITLLGMRRFEITRSSRLIKRSFDLATSLVLLLLLTPLMLAIAITIKLDSRGPVLFRQRRVGRDSKVFDIVKFRSMVVGADDRKNELRHLDEGDGIFKISEDPRLTRVGRWIRRWSLDELPQLWNVAIGEMSLVGPRPLPLDEDEKIEGWYRGRLDIAPGISGYWQALAGEHSLEEMVRLDYVYIANWSLWNDARILIRTIPYVLGRRGR